jgi:hypothetical protein
MAPLDVVTKTSTATIPSAYWAKTEKRMRRGAQSRRLQHLQTSRCVGVMFFERLPQNMALLFRAFLPCKKAGAVELRSGRDRAAGGRLEPWPP